MAGGQVTVQVPTDQRFVHPILREAPGVADAAAGVEAALRAEKDLAEERRLGHVEWREQNRKNALKPGFEPSPEPPRDVSFDESRAFKARVRTAKARLEAVVAAAGEDIVDAVRERELVALEEVREHVAALERLSDEFGLLGKALTAVANATHQRPERQSRPSVADLVYLAGKPGEDVGVLDFGDGRTLWLKVAGHRS